MSPDAVSPSDVLSILTATSNVSCVLLVTLIGETDEAVTFTSEGAASSSPSSGRIMLISVESLSFAVRTVAFGDPSGASTATSWVRMTVVDSLPLSVSSTLSVLVFSPKSSVTVWVA
ncbi:hypothetical protein [Halorubrum miltondacostae]|uniref:hypothetical protein n=1 Tax=Halorubrum miltondacostae TaxID=3076378 RepID=UPI00352965A2